MSWSDPASAILHAIVSAEVYVAEIKLLVLPVYLYHLLSHKSY